MVQTMLNNPSIKKSCYDLAATFLEPAAGEGNFLIAILERKLDMVSKKYSHTLVQFENFSLYVLSTIYGIELLEDNTQVCSMNLYEVYYEKYKEMASKFNKKMKKKVLDSAKVIIKSNIVQGDFLTRKNSKNENIIFSKWAITNALTSTTKTISVARTEYSLEEIFSKKEKKQGTTQKHTSEYKQLNFLSDSGFTLNHNAELDNVRFRYTIVKITDVYKEELERDD